MRRRDFVLLGASTAIAPTPAFSAGNMRRIGFIALGSREERHNLLDAFRQGLEALGPPGNFIILDRWAGERSEQLPKLIGTLIGSAVDVVVTAGTPATLAARHATASIPIVFVGVGDPVASGIVNSMARPGTNATGLSLSSPELSLKRLQVLKELVPSLTRLAVIVRTDPGLEQKLLDIRITAERMGLKVVEFEASTGSALRLAFTHLQNDRCEALYLASGPLGPAKRAAIIALAAAARIPAIYSFDAFSAAGGLMSFATDENDLFRRAAGIVRKILDGANPADLPVQQPTKFKLVVNLKTAKALGLTVPQSLLARADEVIE